MGLVNEKKINIESISSSDKEPRNGESNASNSQGGVSGRFASDSFCKKDGSNEGRGISNSKKGLGCSQNNSTKGVRGGDCNVTKTSSADCEEMGKRSNKQMKTLTVANQKGGVGKTSTIVHLAFYFAEKGLKVSVIDLDPQGNASFTLKKFSTGVKASALFSENNITINSNENISLIESDNSLADMASKSLSDSSFHFKSAISSLSDQGFDVCLIDTAPSLGVTMASALLASDCVMSPVELEIYSIQGIQLMNKTITNLRKVNKNLKFLGILPSKLDRRNPRQVRHIEQLNSAYPQLMIPHQIGLRSSVADALASGTPVWKIKKTAARIAAKEFKALAEFVYIKMEISK